MAMVYLAPKTVEDVVHAVAHAGAAIYAGGTDLIPRWSRELAPRPAAVVDVKKVEQLRGVKWADGEVSVGACVLMSELERDPIIRGAAPILAEAAARVACPQIRNRATVGGNLCNASPAADTAIPLILLDAVLEAVSADSNGLSRREIPITDFFRSPGRTALAPGEVVTNIRFKPLPAGAHWAWDKFGTRPAMEIAVASVGAIVHMENQAVSRARIGFGSVAPTPLRGRRAETALIGQRLTDETIEGCVAAARDEISPITDVRAGEGYRREIVGVMLRRMLENAASR